MICVLPLVIDQLINYDKANLMAGVVGHFNAQLQGVLEKFVFFHNIHTPQPFPIPCKRSVCQEY